MKKFNKLQINSEKLMKNEELMALRGGYGYYCCMCYNGEGQAGYAKSTPNDCANDCFLLCGGRVFGNMEYCPMLENIHKN
jgi:hypothetical protein